MAGDETASLVLRFLVNFGLFVLLTASTCPSCTQLQFHVKNGEKETILDDAGALEEINVSNDVECFLECHRNCRGTAFNVCGTLCHLNERNRCFHGKHQTRKQD